MCSCNCRTTGKSSQFGQSKSKSTDYMTFRWRVYLDDKAQLNLTGAGTKARFRTQTCALAFGDHLIVATYDEKSSRQEWFVDGQSFRLANGGITFLTYYDEYARLRAHVSDSRIDAELGELVKALPFPALLTTAARFGVLYSDKVLEDVNSAVESCLQNRHSVAFVSSGGLDGGGCSESGFCSPEYDSCIDCGGSSGVFGGGFEDWPGDGGGGGGSGGGGDGGGDGGYYQQWCVKQYLDGLNTCNLNLRACRERLRWDQAVVASKEKSKAIGKKFSPKNPAVLTAMTRAYEQDICTLEFDDCLDALMWNFKFCVGGGGWPV